MSEEVRKGYKLTEVGVIPTDWEVKRIGELCDYQNGTSLEHLFNSRDGFKVISIGNYSTEGSYIHRDIYIDPCHEKAVAKFALNKNDLAMSLNDKTSTGAILGRALLIDSDNEYVFNQRTMRLRPKSNISPSFLHHAINGDNLHGALVLLAKPGTQIYINTDDVIDLLVPVPPTAEQQAIVATLSDIGALISSLDQLIAKKRNIQQAAMQQLLTGQRRLPGFSGEWYIKKLGELAFFLKGAALSKNDLTPDGSKKCILYGELFTTYGREIREIYSRTNANSGTPSKLGDVLLPGSTTTSGIDLASAAAVLEDNVLLGGDINIIRPNSKESFDPVFLSQYLTNVAANDIAERAQGITIIHLYGRDLRSLSIKLPTIHEQSAIATTLSVIDNELAALEARRDKAQLLKQGMMQELLSGRIRLTDSSL